jgi:aconitate hydratase
LAKAVRAAEEARQKGESPESALPEIASVMTAVKAHFPASDTGNTGIGSTIFAVKPGDGSAREQAASCQKVLGGWANISHDYATKRYRSNLINWGMLPFVIAEGELPFANKDYLFIPNIREAVAEKWEAVKAYTVRESGLTEFDLTLGYLTDEEREIILRGCLINYNAK